VTTPAERSSAGQPCDRQGAGCRWGPGARSPREGTADPARGARGARPSLIAGGVWLALYTLIGLTGQRFSTAYLTYGWQLAPYRDLRAHPWSSTWNLHVQPPLWNLTVGTIGRWSPFTDALSFQLLMACAGALGAALLADALICRGVPGRWAVPLAVVAMGAPDVIMYGFGVTYELPVATALIALVWAVSRGARSEDHRGRWLVGVAVTATVITMTRTVYHPLWLVAVLAMVAWWWRSRLDRRMIVGAALVPLIAVGGWMVKNQALVGRPTLSTWSGMNLQRAVIPVLDLDELNRMVASGELSQVAAAGPFGRFDLYVPAVGPCVPQPGDDPVLTVLDRGEAEYVPNFNARCYLEVFDLAGEDARTVIRTHPGVFVEGRLWAARTWFALANQPGESDSAPFRRLHGIYDLALVGVPGTLSTTSWGTPIYGPLAVVTQFSLLLVACSIAVVVAGAAALRRAQRWIPAAQIDAVVGFIAAWTFATGIVFELGEQARFRMMTDPLVLAFGILALVRGGDLLRRRFIGRSGAAAEAGGPVEDHVTDHL
jgi:hypothetical protein